MKKLFFLYMLLTVMILISIHNVSANDETDIIHKETSSMKENESIVITNTTETVKAKAMYSNIYSETLYGDIKLTFNYDTKEMIISGKGELKYGSSGGSFYPSSWDPVSLVITDGITSIGDDCFQQCTELVSVKLADSVTSIGDYSFFHCSKLSNVEFGTGLKSIGNTAFCDCYVLTSINIPDGTINIGEQAFSACHQLKDVNLPNSVTSIAFGAFNDCENLEKIELPLNIEEISPGLFSYCKSLESITIPDGVKSIGYDAFKLCDNLKSVEIPKSVQSIDMTSFNMYQTIYYMGTEEDWKKIEITNAFGLEGGSPNGNLDSAIIIYKGNIDAGKGMDGSSVTRSNTSSINAISSEKYASVIISPSVRTLYKKTTLKLKATKKNTSQAIVWYSSNNRVATVDTNGLVRAKKNGKAVITAKVGNATAKCIITVKNPTIKLSKKKVSLNIGKTANLKAKVKGKSKKIKWKSSNKSVVKVNKKGKIKAVGAGTATIFAIANGVKAKCKVTVKSNANNRRSTATSTYSGGGYVSRGGISSSSGQPSGQASSVKAAFSGSGSTTM